VADYAELYDALADKPDEELFAVLGAAGLDTADHVAAALAAWAPDAAADLDADGLFPTSKVVDLARRGRELLDEVVANATDELRERVCVVHVEKPAERDLVLAASPLLSDLILLKLGVINPPGAVVVALAFLLLRYGMNQLCDGYRSPPPTA
jgi:hypothetical protein